MFQSMNFELSRRKRISQAVDIGEKGGLGGFFLKNVSFPHYQNRSPKGPHFNVALDHVTLRNGGLFRRGAK